MNVSERLESVRENEELNIQEFIEPTDFNYHTAYDYHKRDTTPNPEYVRAVAAVYDVDPVWLAFGGENGSPDESTKHRRFRKILQTVPFTHSQIAEAAGVARQTVSRWSLDPDNASFAYYPGDSRARQVISDLKNALDREKERIDGLSWISG